MLMIDLELRLKQNFVEAGTKIKGWVDLANRFRTEASSGMHIVLVGEEVTSIRSSEGVRDEVPKFYNDKVIIIQATVPVKSFSSTGFIEAGRYNFPFEYLLPVKLPSTMASPGDDASGEIRYKLIACLPKKSGEPVFSKPVSVCVVAASTEKETRPVSIPLEQFPVKHCCFIDQGSITLGWETDTTVGAPGSRVSISIVGKNESVVPINHFVASWDEIVTLKCQGKSKVITRTLVSTEYYPKTKLWEPVTRLSSDRRRYWNDNEDSMMQNACKLNFLLPTDARDSSPGTLVTVQHVLSVKVVSNEWCTDSPESCIFVAIQRQMPKKPPKPEPIFQQSLVAAEADVDDNNVGDSKGVSHEEIPMANVKLVDRTESSVTVTAKDAMTNTIQARKIVDKGTRRWRFGTRKKKIA